jgi:hypothetical protein
VQRALAVDLALVGGEEGHAMLASYRGNCYAIMPDHVASQDSLSLVTALPRRIGMAEVFERLPEQDLAIAYVYGDVAAQCTRTWESLPRDLSATLASSAAAGLSRIQFDGQYTDRAAADLIDMDAEHFVAVTSDRWADPEIMTGISGALIFVGNVPAGMALSSPDVTRARFLRIDRIVAALDPILRGGAGQVASKRAVDGEVGYRITGRIGAAGSVGLDSALHVEWTGEPVAIEFTLSEDDPVPLSRIVIETDASDTTVTFPQRVSIQVDRGRPANPYWTPLFAPDMSPLGRLELATGGSTARRVRLQVESVWHAGRPMQIDRVSFE